MPGDSYHRYEKFLQKRPRKAGILNFVSPFLFGLDLSNSYFPFSMKVQFNAYLQIIEQRYMHFAISGLATESLKMSFTKSWSTLLALKVNPFANMIATFYSQLNALCIVLQRPVELVQILLQLRLRDRYYKLTSTALKHETTVPWNVSIILKKWITLYEYLIYFRLFNLLDLN